LHLKLVIAKLRRLEFGRRSERLTGMIGQLELSLEALEETCAEQTVPPVLAPSAETAPRPPPPPLARPCRHTCPVSVSSLCPIRPAVRRVAANSNGWGKTSVSHSNTSRRASG
jgi:hypothetical protein